MSGVGGEAAAEQYARDGLADEIERHYRGVSDAALIRQMEAAPDFGYDDQEFELNRRLAKVGMNWKWVKDAHGRDAVEVYLIAPETVNDESSPLLQDITDVWNQIKPTGPDVVEVHVRHEDGDGQDS